MILVKRWKFYLCMFLYKWALKYCLMIIEVENKPSQTIKIWILQSCHAEISYIGVNPRFWSKIANFLFVCLFALFFGKISLEIMSDDHLVKNQALFQSKVLAI